MCRYDVEHPVVNDSEMSMWYSLGISSWPTQVVVAPTGKLIIALPGEGRKADIDDCIQAALDYYGEAGLLINSAVPVVLRPAARIASPCLARGVLTPMRCLEQRGARRLWVLLCAEPAPAVGLRMWHYCTGAVFAQQRGRCVQALERDKQTVVINTALRFPGKLAIDERGGRLFVADSSNHRVVVTDLAGRFVAQVGGNGSGLVDGPLTRAALNRPQGLAYSVQGDKLYIADTENHAVRCVDFVAGVVSTLAGNGVKGSDLVGGGRRGAQQLNSPWDVELVADGRRLLVAMAGQHQIWDVDVETGACAALSGTGAERNQNGSTGGSTAWAQPSGLSLTPDGKAACASLMAFTRVWRRLPCCPVIDGAVFCVHSVCTLLLVRISVSPVMSGLSCNGCGRTCCIPLRG